MRGASAARATRTTVCTARPLSVAELRCSGAVAVQAGVAGRTGRRPAGLAKGLAAPQPQQLPTVPPTPATQPLQPAATTIPAAVKRAVVPEAVHPAAAPAGPAGQAGLAAAPDFAVSASLPCQPGRQPARAPSQSEQPAAVTSGPAASLPRPSATSTTTSSTAAATTTTKACPPGLPTATLTAATFPKCGAEPVPTVSITGTAAVPAVRLPEL